MNRKSELSLRDHALEITLSWLWFFLILLAYYCLKPVRDGLGSSQAGNLGNLYLATFISSIVALSLYSKLIATIPRTWLLVSVYQFFVLCLLGFISQFATDGETSANLVRVFFVWVSVFNLFVVTLFWSVMADLFSAAQAKAWFGIIAAAGSVGSISGSAIAVQLSRWFGTRGLAITSIVALELAIVVGLILMRLSRRSSQIESTDHGEQEAKVAAGEPSDTTSESDKDTQGTGGSIFAGFTRVLQSPYLIGICLFVAVGKFAATFIYNNLQLVLGEEITDEAQRTTLFSQMNLIAQSGSLITQAIIAGIIMKRLGIAVALIIPSAALFCFFGWLSMDTMLRTLIVGQVGQQILGYGLLVPAQHVLFTVVSREDKYKSKAFTDIVVFRGSDVAAGKLCDLMIWSETLLSTLAIGMLPVVAFWGLVGTWLGRRYKALASSSPSGER